MSLETLGLSAAGLCVMRSHRVGPHCLPPWAWRGVAAVDSRIVLADGHVQMQQSTDSETQWDVRSGRGRTVKLCSRKW